MLDAFPGDLSVRISFARIYGGGPDQGKLRPAIEISDGTSGKTLTLEITPEQLADMLSGSAAQVPADQVRGFTGLKKWGMYRETVQRVTATRPGDYAHRDKPHELEHVAHVIEQIEAEGYTCAEPRMNNAGKWVIVGYRYGEKP